MSRATNPIPAFPSRVAAMLVGFAVGDALGAPAAGVRSSRFLGQHGPITGFATDPRHPLLGHLGPGQYTENTRLLLDAAADAFDSCGFARAARIESLRRWAGRIAGDPTASRWPGPTTLAAAASLTSSPEPTPRRSESVGASYRVPPLAATVPGEEELLHAARQEALLTHVSEDSVAAACVVALLLYKLLDGKEIREAVPTTLAEIERYLGANRVPSVCRAAIGQRDQTLDELRRRTGTGALARESLPLVLAIAIGSEGDFTQAVLQGANCFRGDEVDPPEGCSSYAEELERVNGGNTDGIAALAGCITGAAVGLEGIADCWKSVEGYNEIVVLARRCAPGPAEGDHDP